MHYTEQTRITLQKIKHSEFASQETHCFEAVVCFDGTRCAVVNNDGQGGNDGLRIENVDVWNAMTAYIDTFEPIHLCDEHYTPADLEYVTGHLMEEHLDLKAMKALLSRRVVYVAGKYLMQSTPRKAPARDALARAWALQDRQVLNLMDTPAAFKIWKDHT